MPVFKLGCAVTVSAYTEVEADTLEEAIEEAEGRDVGLGGVTSGIDPAEMWSIDDADGAPQDVHAIDG